MYFGYSNIEIGISMVYGKRNKLDVCRTQFESWKGNIEPILSFKEQYSKQQHIKPEKCFKGLTEVMVCGTGIHLILLVNEPY